MSILAKSFALVLLLATSSYADRHTESQGATTEVQSAAKARRASTARNLRARAARAAKGRAAHNSAATSNSENAELEEIIQKVQGLKYDDFTGTLPPMGLVDSMDPTKGQSVEYTLHGDLNAGSSVPLLDDHKWIDWLKKQHIAPLEKAKLRDSFHPEDWLPGAVKDGTLPDTRWIPEDSHGVFFDYVGDGMDVRDLEDADAKDKRTQRRMIKKSKRRNLPPNTRIIT